MEVEFQDQGQLHQDFEEWLYPRGSQSVHGLFSEEEKKESIRIEDSAPEIAIISNEAPVVVKCSEKVEGSGEIYIHLCAADYTRNNMIP